MNTAEVRSFHVTQLVPFLRAMVDPTDSGEISPADRAMLAQVEANVARLDDADRS